VKYLAIVERTANGFRAHAPRLPDCEVLAASPKEAEVRIIAAVKAHPDALRANGRDPGEIEVIVAVDDSALRSPREDGMRADHDSLPKESKLEDLEWALTFDIEREIAAGISGEDLSRELDNEENRLSGETKG
jgi:hypothetical protein